MIYLDYSATTPVNDEVLDTFVKVSKEYIGNPNSLHKLGLESKSLIDAATKQIKEILNLKDSEVIYTSGSSEANNTAIIGVIEKYSNRGHHIITTRFEHSSIIGPLSYLQNDGYDVDFVDVDENGLVSIDNLKKLIRDDTILITIGAVNSEIGVVQPIEEIASFLKKYPKIIFHSDMTQAIGKIKFDYNKLDMFSLSAQKFYGIKGVGALIKKEKLVIEPLIHGGKSTTIYRSGTPAVALIASLAKALRLAYIDIDKKYEYVSELNTYLKEKLENIEGVHINSNSYCSPYVLNLSIDNIKPEVMLHALEMEEVYISTQTACSKGGESLAVYTLTNSHELANHSIRISLSYLTSKEELDTFIEVFTKKIKELNL